MQGGLYVCACVKAGGVGHAVVWAVVIVSADL